MRICYFGTYEKNYPRNSVVINALRKKGVDVVECHAPFWEKKEHKTKLPFLEKITLFAKLPLIYLGLILRFKKLKKKNDFDCIIVGYIGQFDMFVARLIAPKEKIIFNPMISLYDSLVVDRKMIKNSLLKKLIHWLDRKSCKLAGLAVLDTEDHAEYFRKEFGLENVGVLYIGADEIFRPRKAKKEGKHFKVLYYGKFTPLQGIEYIIKSAKLLEKHKDIRFEIIGTGQTYESNISLAKNLGIKNIKFTEWVDYGRLPGRIAEADICLGGHFGGSNKALRVVANKVFQIIAMAKPVIVNNGPAIRDAGFKDRVNCLFADVASPASIAKAILALKNNPGLRKKIGIGAYKLFTSRFSDKKIAKNLVQQINNIKKA